MFGGAAVIGVTSGLPIALIGDSSTAAIIGGIFAITNTILVARMSHDARTTRKILDRRNHEEDPPPDGRYKRRRDRWTP